MIDKRISAPFLLVGGILMVENYAVEVIKTGCTLDCEAPIVRMPVSATSGSVIDTQLMTYAQVENRQHADGLVNLDINSDWPNYPIKLI